MYDEYHKTSYETEPVENISQAIRAFVTAYDSVHNILPIEHDPLGEALRLAIYSPVKPLADEKSPPISLYEIGVTHSPHRSVAGRYGVNEIKLNDALEKRTEDVRALLIQEDSGILLKVCEIITAFLEEEHELQDPVFAAIMRLLNECRRLIVMWE